MFGWPARGVWSSLSDGAGERISAGRIPRASAAASAPGRLAVNEDTIFLRNL